MSEPVSHELAGDNNQPEYQAPSARPQEVKPFQKMQPGGGDGWTTDFRPIALPADAESELVTGPKASSVPAPAKSSDSTTDQSLVETASVEKASPPKPPSAPGKPTS